MTWDHTNSWQSRLRPGATWSWRRLIPLSEKNALNQGWSASVSAEVQGITTDGQVVLMWVQDPWKGELVYIALTELMAMHEIGVWI